MKTITELFLNLTVAPLAMFVRPLAPIGTHSWILASAVAVAMTGHTIAWAFLWTSLTLQLLVSSIFNASMRMRGGYMQTHVMQKHRIKRPDVNMHRVEVALMLGAFYINFEYMQSTAALVMLCVGTVMHTAAYYRLIAMYKMQQTTCMCLACRVRRAAFTILTNKTEFEA